MFEPLLSMNGVSFASNELMIGADDDNRRAGEKDCNGQVEVRGLWGNGAGKVPPGVLGERKGTMRRKR